MLRRAYIRHPIVIPLDYNIANAASQYRKSTDLSVGGLSFKSDSYIAPGTLLHLRIHVSDPVFAVDAKVKWCGSSEDKFDVGVQFLNEQVAYTVRMVEQVCHIREYQMLEQQQGRHLSDEEAASEWIDRLAHQFPQNIN